MNHGIKRLFLFSRTILLLMSLVWPAVCGCAETSTSSDVYAASLTDAAVFINVPALRQYGDYTCGATCVQMLMNWLYPYEADRNLTQYEEALLTSPEIGTSPQALLNYFEEAKIEFDAAQHMSLSTLRQALDEGHPVMMALQAWSSADDGSYNLDDPSEPESYLTEGHWVICVGYCQSDHQLYFIFNDPACVGHSLLYENELEQRWIDVDGSGEIYDHFGIKILQKTRYDSSGLFHMD